MNEDVRKIKLLLIFIAFVLIGSAYNNRLNATDVRDTVRAEIQKLMPVKVNEQTYYITVPTDDKN